MPYTHSRIFLRSLVVSPANEEFRVANKIIKKVDIIGNIVHLNERETIIFFHLDDLTGTINCVQFKNSLSTEVPHSSLGKPHTNKAEIIQSSAIPSRPLCPGDLINVRGKLKFFRNEPQIICNTIRHVLNPNEVWFRIKEIELYETYLKQQAKKAINQQNSANAETRINKILQFKET